MHFVVLYKLRDGKRDRRGDHKKHNKCINLSGYCRRSTNTLLDLLPPPPPKAPRYAEMGSWQPLPSQGLHNSLQSPLRISIPTPSLFVPKPRVLVAQKAVWFGGEGGGFAVTWWTKRPFYWAWWAPHRLQGLIEWLRQISELQPVFIDSGEGARGEGSG